MAAIAVAIVVVAGAAAWLGGACGHKEPGVPTGTPYVSASAPPAASSAPPPVDSASVDAAADADVDASASEKSEKVEDGGVHHHHDGGAGHLVTVDDASAGKTVDLAPGSKLVVALKSAPNNGFDWSVTKAPAALGKPEMSFVPAASEELGAKGTRKLTFTPGALPPGEHEVELGYARSFEPGKPPARTFKFKVRSVKE